MQWILDRKAELGADVNLANSNGLSPLFLVCLKGYVGADTVERARTDSVKAGRLEIAKMLVEHGANIDFRETVGLTPLHWAAYNADAELCRFLLARGAMQIESDAGSCPVDIAGFSGHYPVVKVFMEHTAKKIEHKYHMQGPGTSDKVDLDSAVKKPKFDELEYLSKLEKA